ncbi:general stress protein [Paenarthrobacter ureafaciens]|uniref:general stress protein n=1 Tax=Paenarthrobacter ureafaciens TaxID=37931 RepID=UPI003CF5AC66
MSNIFGGPKAVEEARSVPQGDTVGSYTSYLDAQKAVDYLADQQFPVQLVSIVGNDLKMVERVTGRLSYPRVALSGALSGMWFGLFVGVMLSFFTPGGGPFSIITSVLMGAAFFMLFGIVTYATQRGKRDFTSTSQVVATNYDVIVAFEAANEARRLLQQLPMNPAQAAGQGQGYASRQEPSQPSQPFQQPGQAPERPSTWNDPYGQRAPQPGEPEPRPAQPDPAPAPSSARYPDLPDGRPQYGIRVPEGQPQQGQQPQQSQQSRHSHQGSDDNGRHEAERPQPDQNQAGQESPEASEHDAGRQ